ncbi:hypothetical protein L227DRAFT_412568 [Lentinus tigrinus ALCF2SS1-6]|uniref:Uncharacterized protein n=1 Tax=Lentinus tigrinus ALCF2SS1-6 TaxID=1328759 RepID=A0A5C2SII7_9APHY|nr:hypothetical protein L227DRAFT_412568 [Lentinus tigrinus ALCF2SS1-6]
MGQHPRGMGAGGKKAREIWWRAIALVLFPASVELVYYPPDASAAKPAWIRHDPSFLLLHIRKLAPRSHALRAGQSCAPRVSRSALPASFSDAVHKLQLNE